MPAVRIGQNFACGNCKRQMDAGEDYYVVDSIGYCINCIDEMEAVSAQGAASIVPK